MRYFWKNVKKIKYFPMDFPFVVSLLHMLVPQKQVVDLNLCLLEDYRDSNLTTRNLCEPLIWTQTRLSGVEAKGEKHALDSYM